MEQPKTETNDWISTLLSDNKPNPNVAPQVTSMPLPEQNVVPPVVPATAQPIVPQAAPVQQQVAQPQANEMQTAMASYNNQRMQAAVKAGIDPQAFVKAMDTISIEDQIALFQRTNAPRPPAPSLANEHGAQTVNVRPTSNFGKSNQPIF